MMGKHSMADDLTITRTDLPVIDQATIGARTQAFLALWEDAEAESRTEIPGRVRRALARIRSLFR